MSSAHSMNARKWVHAQKPYSCQAFAHESIDETIKSTINKQQIFALHIFIMEPQTLHFNQLQIAFFFLLFKEKIVILTLFFAIFCCQLSNSNSLKPDSSCRLSSDSKKLFFRIKSLAKKVNGKKLSSPQVRRN